MRPQSCCFLQVVVWGLPFENHPPGEEKENDGDMRHEWRSENTALFKRTKRKKNVEIEVSDSFKPRYIHINMPIAGYLLIFFLIYPVILYNSEDRMSPNQTRGHVLGRILVRGGLKMNVTGCAGSLRTWSTCLSLELETNIWHQF